MQHRGEAPTNPPLVSAGEVRKLRASLAEAVAGRELELSGAFTVNDSPDS